MIPFKLAKKLKEAGWKQETRREAFSIEAKEGDFQYEKGGINKVVIPTLPELIGACANGFLKLEHLVSGEETFFGKTKKNTWKASGYKRINKKGGIHHFTIIRTTPEEAVANLWLKLYEK